MTRVRAVNDLRVRAWEGGRREAAQSPAEDEPPEGAEPPEGVPARTPAGDGTSLSGAPAE